MWFLHPPKSRRRWHVFTWLAAVPALAFVALVQIAGVEADSRELLKTQRWKSGPTMVPYGFSPNGSLPPFADPIPDRVVEYSHGWPCEWHRRAFGYHWTMSQFALDVAEYQDLRTGYVLDDPSDSDIAISWRSSRAWPGFGAAHASRFSPVGLAANLLVAVGIVATTMAVSEIWLRRRGGAFRLKIIDFLAVAVAMACVLGFWRWDRGVQDREQEAWQRATTQYSLRTADVELELEYVGPEWLARLCGNSRAVPVLQRFDNLSLRISDPEEARLDWLKDLRSLRTVNVDIGKGTYPTILEMFGSKTSLRELSLKLGGDDRNAHQYIESLADFQRLESIHLDTTPLVDDLYQLKGLPRLRELRFSKYLITKEELEQLQLAFPGVEIEPFGGRNYVPKYQREHIALARLNRKFDARCDLTGDGQMLRWDGAPFTAENLRPLAGVLPKLHVLELVEAVINPADLPDFGQLSNVTNVVLSTSNLPVEFMQQVADLPNLVKVSVYRRPETLEPLLALRQRPPRTLYLANTSDFSSDEMEVLRDAFGNRLELGNP